MLNLLALPFPSRVYTPDLKALRQLYELLDGEQWTNNRGWIVQPCGDDTTYCNDWELAKCEADSTHCLPWHLDPCNDEAISWYGVACVDPCNEVWDGGSCKAGRITQVSLGDNNLRGSLSAWAQVGRLTNVTFLDLSRNSISGTLPSEIGEIKNLMHSTSTTTRSRGRSCRSSAMSTVSECGLNGVYDACPIADIEGTCTSRCSSSTSGATGWRTLPSNLGLLYDLEMLDVSYNDLSGSIPNELSEMSRLQVSTSRTIPGGALPVDLGELSELRYFNVVEQYPGRSRRQSAAARRCRSSTSSAPDHRRAAALARRPVEPALLRLQDNQLTANFTKFSTLGNLRGLKELDLYNNKMHGRVPDSIQNLTSLEFLYVQNDHRCHRKHCRERLPNVGKYNHRFVRDDYVNMMAQNGTPRGRSNGAGAHPPPSAPDAPPHPPATARTCTTLASPSTRSRSRRGCTSSRRGRGRTRTTTTTRGGARGAAAAADAARADPVVADRGGAGKAGWKESEHS